MGFFADEVGAQPDLLTAVLERPGLGVCHQRFPYSPAAYRFVDHQPADFSRPVCLQPRRDVDVHPAGCTPFSFRDEDGMVEVLQHFRQAPGKILGSGWVTELGT